MNGVIAVDWGSSAFRLWLLAADGQVLAESRGAEGMDHCTRHGFAPVLASHLAAVAAPADWPVLICGMAGARQGWAEAPYLDLPCRLTDLARHALRLPVPQAMGRDIRILPGLARRDARRPDVLRGEETQLLGLSRAGHDGVICMPGTHCKWVTLAAGTVVDLCTFMTGELFALLSRQSLLRFGLSGAEPGALTAETPEFAAALDQALEDPAGLGEALFPLRAAGLLGFAGPQEGLARLSGLLIGAEVGRMARHLTGTVTLLGQSGLGALYLAALQRAGVAPRQAEADHMTRAGLAAAAAQIWET